MTAVCRGGGELRCETWGIAWQVALHCAAEGWQVVPCCVYAEGALHRIGVRLVGGDPGWEEGGWRPAGEMAGGNRGEGLQIALVPAACLGAELLFVLAVLFCLQNLAALETRLCSAGSAQQHGLFSMAGMIVASWPRESAGLSWFPI